MAGSSSVAEVSGERQSARIASRMNWLRAGVMGANDGIVSTAGVVVGVVGASVSSGALLATGIAAVVAGAISMAVGEYVSVSSQRDSQTAELATERTQLRTDPEEELNQLTRLIQAQGIEIDLARRVAAQLTEKDALTAHARLELGIDPDELVSPWRAAWASMVAFVLGHWCRWSQSCCRRGLLPCQSRLSPLYSPSRRPDPSRRTWVARESSVR